MSELENIFREQGDRIDRIDQLEELLKEIKEEVNNTEDVGGFCLWLQEKLKDL